MDAEYILGCAFELAETTAVENSVLSSQRGAYWEIRTAVDRNVQISEHFLQNTARAKLSEATPPEKYFLALSAFNGLEFSLKALAEKAAHLVQTKCQQDLGHELPRPGGLRRGESSLSLNLPALPSASDLNEPFVRQMLDAMLASEVTRWSEDLQLMAQAGAWYLDNEGRVFDAMLGQIGGASQPAGEPGEHMLKAMAAQREAVRKAQAAERSLRAKAKAAIKKATRLFQGFGQEQNLKLFVSGSEVVLSHPESRFKFVLMPLKVSDWLVDNTMKVYARTPYELKLFTKDDVFLSKLCVYFDQTPVLDQLLALTLFVQSGEELTVLEKANWFGLEHWNEAKTELVLKAYPQLEPKLPRLGAPGVVPGITAIHESAFFQKEAKWKPFKANVQQWVDAWLQPATLAAKQLLEAYPEVVEKFRVTQSLRQTRDNREQGTFQPGLHALARDIA